jgi:hypothetical protein
MGKTIEELLEALGDEGGRVEMLRP